MPTSSKSLQKLHPGLYLGRYELLMPVAQGGMAAVWAARLRGTRGFQRLVAIKTILPTLSEDTRFEQMFLVEAGLASRIRHPNVVQVLDLGEEHELLYQVMEWIDGEPLSTFLRVVPPGSGLPYPMAARIMIGVCEGLHAAHEARDDNDQAVGLVHRDVSPQNILITRDGVPKVVDFGVAKASTLSNVETLSGTLKGKPGYMAPEQIQGDDIDRRADVFSLGVLLYVLTTGKHPFRGDNDMATLHRICSKEPPVKPSVVQPGFPAALEMVVMTAMRKVRDTRFSTAAAMARAIEQAVPDVHKTGDAEVAAYMRALLSDKLDSRAAALRAALAEADDRPSQTAVGKPATLPGVGPGPQSRDQATKPPPAAPTLISASMAPEVPPMPQLDTSPPVTHAKAATDPSASKGRSPWLLVIAAAIVLASAGVAGAFLLRGAVRKPVEPAAAEASPPPQSADQPAVEVATVRPEVPVIPPEALPAFQEPPPAPEKVEVRTLPPKKGAPPAPSAAPPEPTPPEKQPAPPKQTGPLPFRDPGF